MSFAIAVGPGTEVVRQAVRWESTAAGEGAVSSPTPEGFSGVLRAVMGRVDGAQQDAQQAVVHALGGEGTDVHEAVIAVERAELTFEFAVQVRNKVVQAYQEISRMQF